MPGCYSFTGGSVPKHLKTLYIGTVNDNSGYGNPRYREALTQLLVNKFRSDNSFTIVDRGGDAKLYITITSIRDEIVTVRPGEIENERRITVNCNAEYYDAVLKKSVFKQDFPRYGNYPISGAAQQEKDNAVQKALDQIAEDILLAVVSGW